MRAENWILVRECAPDRSQVPAGIRVDLGHTVVVGREGDLLLGVAYDDVGISRNAVALTATHEGWRIEVANRNGAVIHPWGLAPYRAQPVQLLRWPLIGIRVAGAEPSQQHWVLLESDGYAVGSTDPVTGTTPALTRRGAPPPPLAPAELSALELVFADHLAWPPPTSAPVPRQLKQVAARLGKSLSGVQDRLRSAQDKALRLGLANAVTLTQPEYFHVLVAAGYVMPSSRRPCRHDLTAASVQR